MARSASRGAEPGRVAPAMTTFVLLHGGAHTSWCWRRVAAELEGRGHVVVAPDLPFDRPGVTVAECAGAVRRAVPVDVSAPTVVAHSLGGTVLPQAASVLGAGAMVFLCAVVPREGMSIAARVEAEGFVRFPYERAGRDEQGRVLVPADVALEYFYPACLPEIAAEAVRHLRPQAPGPLTEVLGPGELAGGARGMRRVRRGPASGPGLGPERGPGPQRAGARGAARVALADAEQACRTGRGALRAHPGRRPGCEPGRT